METPLSLARRMAAITPFQVMELVARAKQLEAEGHDVIHMEVGEPDFPTPAPVIEATQQVLATGRIHYTAALGLPELRAAISRDYYARYGTDVAPERIVITTGASGALLLALGVLVDRDDEWLLPDPGYPCNANFMHLLEGRVRRLVTQAADAYQPTAAQVTGAWGPQTRGVLIASPANPTGTLISAGALAALHAAVQAQRGTLIVDEIYHGLTYGVQAESATALGEDVFVINSFSKYFGLTGWRVGWLVAPTAYVREIEKLAQNLYIAPPTLAQHAALAALGPETRPILEERRRAFAERRDVLRAGLQKLSLELRSEPQGAFYLYARLPEQYGSSFDFARALLETAHVAITPGRDFGQHEADRHLRFAYTTDIARLEEGLVRLAGFMARFFA